MSGPGSNQGTVGLTYIDVNTWQINNLPNRTAMRVDVAYMYLWCTQNCQGSFKFDSNTIPLSDLGPDYQHLTYNDGKKWLYSTFKFSLDSDSELFGNVWMFGVGVLND